MARSEREVAADPPCAPAGAEGAPRWGQAALRILLVWVPAIAVCSLFRHRTVAWLAVPTVQALFPDQQPEMHLSLLHSPLEYWYATAFAALLLTSPWGFYQVSRELARGADRVRALVPRYVAVSVAAALGSTWLVRSVLAPATVVALMGDPFQQSPRWLDETLRFVCSMACIAIAATQLPIGVAFVVAARRVGWARLLRLGGVWLVVSVAWAALTSRQGLPPLGVASILIGIYYASVLGAYLLEPRRTPSARPSR